MSAEDREAYEESLRHSLVTNAKELLQGPFAVNGKQAFILRQLVEQFDWVAADKNVAPF